MWNRLLAACIRYFILLFSGRVRLSIPAADDTSRPDGERINIKVGAKPFYKVEKSTPRQPPTARLDVTFHVSQISVFNRYFIPFASIPFFAGAPGFISKTFYLDVQNRAFSGFYEWADRDSIENYLDAYAAKFMGLISEPGTLTCRIHPVSELSRND